MKYQRSKIMYNYNILFRYLNYFKGRHTFFYSVKVFFLICWQTLTIYQYGLVKIFDNQSQLKHRSNKMQPKIKLKKEFVYFYRLGNYITFGKRNNDEIRIFKLV